MTLPELHELEEKLKNRVLVLTPIYRKRRRALSQINLLLGEAINKMQDCRRKILQLEGKIIILPPSGERRQDRKTAQKGQMTLAQVKESLKNLPKEELQEFLEMFEEKEQQEG